MELGAFPPRFAARRELLVTILSCLRLFREQHDSIGFHGKGGQDVGMDKNFAWLLFGKNLADSRCKTVCAEAGIT